jgi:AbiV family abortive infection protein
LEQAHRLIKSSVTLIKDGDYATSVVLSAFAHEEVGRYHILRKLRESVLTNGDEVSIEKINNDCNNHRTRQKEGQGNTSISVAEDSKLGRAIDVITNPNDSDDSTYREAQALICAEMIKEREGLPSERHLMRLDALYVHPYDASTWNRPADIGRQTARVAVAEAANAYSFERNRLIDPAPDHEFATAMKAWPECPELPEPIFP